MPELQIRFDRPERFTFDDEDLVVEEGAIFLRRRDATGNFDPSGTFSASEEIILENIIADGITEFFGFEEISYIPEDTDGVILGQIDYQISVDAGATFLYWDGGAWSAAGATDFNQDDVVAANISTLPLENPRQVQLKVRLQSLEVEMATPALFEVNIFVEYRFNDLEDIKRSLKQYIDDNINIFLFAFERLATDTDTFTLDTDFGIREVLAVYNLTTDPNKQTDIFASNVGNTINLTAPQTTGDKLEIQYHGTAPVFLRAADEDFTPSELPAIVVTVDPYLEDKEFLRDGRTLKERNFATGIARKRLPPVYMEGAVEIRSVSELVHASLALSAAVDELFQFDKNVTSIMTGEPMPITNYESIADESATLTSMFVKAAAFNITRAAFRGGFTEVPIPDEMCLRVGSLKRAFKEYCFDREGELVSIEHLPS